MAQLIDGKKISQEIKDELKERELVLRSIYIMRKGKKFLHTLKG